MRRLSLLSFGLVVLAVTTTGLLALAQSSSEKLPVDVELVIAADGSGSISDAELAVQREGYAAAITDPQILNVIRSGIHGRIAVAYLEWGGADSQEIIADWQLIENVDQAEAFARVIRQTPRKAFGWNSISNAIAAATAMIESNDYDGFRKVIDVSGDSGQYGGMPLPIARQRALNAGITINGLTLNYRGGGLSGPGGMPLTLHYERDIIGGPGAFVKSVEVPEAFHDAILEKLLLEIAATPHDNPNIQHAQAKPLLD